MVSSSDERGIEQDRGQVTVAELNGAEQQHGASKYLKKFEPEARNGFRAAMSKLAPGCGSRRLARLFDGRVPPHRVADWLADRRPVPQWAIDLLEQRTRERRDSELAAIAQIKTGPGSAKAGAYALARWRASQHRAT